jgi:hypothetical protein
LLPPSGRLCYSSALRRDAGEYRDYDDESVSFQALRFDGARAAR